MDTALFKELMEQNTISEEEYIKVAGHKSQPINVYPELTTLLYLGILLFTAGLGILIYKNLDTIGHQVVVIFIALVSIACFIYSIIHAKGFSRSKVDSPGIVYDYILLLGCLLLLTFIAYVQFEYNLFGTHWGLAAFVPMVILFAAAYYFDHIGVLALAISNLATWVGFTITPMHLWSGANDKIIHAGIVLGLFLLAVSYITTIKDHKAHFGFTYKNFGMHILLTSLLAGSFTYDHVYLFYFIALAAVCFFFFRNAIRDSSFYLLAVSAGYFYIGVSYVVVHLTAEQAFSMGIIYLNSIYFIISGIMLIWMLIHYNKIIKQNGKV